MSISEILGAAALIFFFWLVNKIVESVSRKKKEKKEAKARAAEPVFTPRRFSVPEPAGECAGGHQFDEAYPGEYIRDTPYLPMMISSCVTKRCRICGCREKPLLGPEDLPKGKEIPADVKERVYRYAKIREMSQQELQDLIRDPEEDLSCRIYAAECITDEERILQLLHENHRKNPKDEDTAVWTRLVWQLPAAPGGLFEKIAADASCPRGARRAAVTRILDTDALDRLEADPVLAAACKKQRPEAVCREGHDWKVIRTTIKSHDDYRMNSPYWVADTFRCTRCGKTREGEMYMTMTSPFAKDD